MGNQKVPYHRLKGFRVRCHSFRINHGDNQTGFSHTGRVSPVSPDHPANLCADFFGVLKRPHNVGAYIFFKISAAHRKHKEQILVRQPAAFKPVDKCRVPPVVIDTGRKLGHIIRWRIGFYSADFSEIIDCMRSISGASADTHKKNPASYSPHFRHKLRHGFHLCGINFFYDFYGLFQILLGV